MSVDAVVVRFAVGWIRKHGISRSWTLRSVIRWTVGCSSITICNFSQIAVANCRVETISRRTLDDAVVSFDAHKE